MKRIEFEVVSTRGGDDGQTGLYSGERLYKSDIVFETVGELDALNSHLGLVKVEFRKMHQKKAVDFIDSVQSDIIALSGQIATNPVTQQGQEMFEQLRLITEKKDVRRIEKYQKKLLNDVDIKPIFINPGESKISALLDVARTQARKSERSIVQLIRDRIRTDLYDVQKYVNRLSDVFFVMARYWGQGHEEFDD